ncbi:MAG TPA: hypothetical protein VMF62_12315 [Acetobacteraceae bacterium]|nr:hypothetical protein [Acetobacteraceae bacterium]
MARSTSDGPVVTSNQITLAFATLAKLADAARDTAAATVAAAIVTARGKPTSIKDVLEITRDARMAMFPDESKRDETWEQTKEVRLGKVHK